MAETNNSQMSPAEQGTNETAQTAASSAAKVTASEAKHEQQPRSFTQEEVDRIVADRLARANRETEKKIKAARDEGMAEAERMAQMTESQRAEHAAREASEREERIRSREADLTRRELRAEAIDTLIARGLPRELEQLLSYTDADACAKSLDELERVFRGAVQKGVDERIKATHTELPKPGGAQSIMMDRMRAAAGLK